MMADAEGFIYVYNQNHVLNLHSNQFSIHQNFSAKFKASLNLAFVDYVQVLEVLT